MREGIISFKVNSKEKKEIKEMAKKNGFKTVSSFLWWLINNSSKLAILILSLVMLSGCTTAGPFVTNISSDGRGGLNIEKQKVQYNMLLGVVSTEQATQSNIQLSNPPQASPPAK